MNNRDVVMIEEAKRIFREADKLTAQAEDILAPLIKRLVDSNDFDGARELLWQLPTSFHKSELRTWLVTNNQQ